MSLRAIVICVGLVLVLFGVSSAVIAEPPKKPSEDAGSLAPSSFLRLGELAQAAADLRKAGEAFEGLAKSVERITETVGKSLAAVSSEFDPFGYKTAFRTVGQQTQIIQQQNEVIRDLQQREIKRLQRENATLRKQLDKLRARYRRQGGEH